MAVQIKDQDRASSRLAAEVKPHFYDIKITPDLSAASFSGEQSITLELSSPRSEIVMNAAELIISKAVIRNESGSTFNASIRLNEEKQQATITLDGCAGAGEWFLDLSFTGILNDKLRGFYRSTFRDADGNEKLIATTKFEPSDARRAFPCFDEPEFKAVFQISLVVDEDHAAISNSPAVSETDLAGGKKLIKFAPSLRMSSYLVAYVVGDFVASDQIFSKGGVPVRVWCVPEKKHLARFALDWAKFSLDFFAEYFGIAYPGTKLDLIAIPDFASGAMENFGAITFRETALLLDKTKATLAELQRVAEVVSHEIAHMWFGDLVTMSWWNGLWLNEAFATFMSALAVDDFEPDWKFWEAFNIARAAAMRVDGLNSSRSIEFPVATPEDARAMFDVLTYEKGCAILRMLELYIGSAIFQKGCAIYMKRHACGNTETKDLWIAISEAVREAGLSIAADKLMDTWVFQQGFPLVTIESGRSAGSIVLRQRPFRYCSDGSNPGELWHVPVAVRAGRSKFSTEEYFLLTESEQVFYTGEEFSWLVVNADGKGFYRVSYSDDLLAMLLRYKAQLSASERFNLLNDLWAATQAGALRLAAYLDNLRLILEGETDYNLFYLAANSITYLRRICSAGCPEFFANFVNLVKELFEPVLAQIGWETVPGEDPHRSELRALLISTLGSLGESSCCTKVAQLWQQYLDNPESISPTLVPAIIETTAAGGDAACYDQMIKLRQTAPTPQAETRFLFALSNFRRAELTGRTLNSILSGEIRVQDAPQMVRALLLNPESGPATWNFLKKNWSTLVAKLPLQGIIRLCDGITALVDPDLEKEIRAFFAINNIKGNEKALAQNLETLSIANRFLAREGEQLKQILKSRPHSD